MPGTALHAGNRAEKRQKDHWSIEVWRELEGPVRNIPYVVWEKVMGSREAHRAKGEGGSGGVAA